MFPQMRVSTGDWDGANNMTMGMFSFIMFMCFVLARMSEKGSIAIFFLDVVLGLSVSDIVDRLFFDVTIFGKNDWLFLGVTVFIAILDLRKNLTTHEQAGSSGST